jgi:hypothetical protein
MVEETAQALSQIAEELLAMCLLENRRDGLE